MFIPESSEMASTLMKNGQTSLILTFEAISLMRLGSGYMSPAWNMGIVMAIWWECQGKYQKNARLDMLFKASTWKKAENRWLSVLADVFNQVLTKFNVSKLLALLILPWVAALRTRYTLDASDMFSSKLGYVGEPKEKKNIAELLFQGNKNSVLR